MEIEKYSLNIFLNIEYVFALLKCAYLMRTISGIDEETV